MGEERTTGEGPRRQSFWSTLPGILTAVAGVIAAITGLIVAIDQARRSRAGESPAAAISAPASKASAPAAGGGTKSAAGQSVALPAGQEARMGGGEHIFNILSARLDPFNADTRALRLRVRFLNNSKTLDRTYYSTFRLIVDDVPLAPAEAPLVQIEAQSAQDVDYSFQVPASARHAVLRIGWKEETAEIPFDFGH